MRHRILRTFTGPFAIIQVDASSLRTTWLDRQAELMLKQSREDRGLLPDLARRLSRYFDGDADVDFSDVPLAAGGAFFRRCWKVCRRIPRGEARSYAELASLAGSPAAARAAGQAMRNNPLPIIVPCHRVVGSNGLLHGFGGTTRSHSKPLDIKRALLEMEGAMTDDVLPGLSTFIGRTSAPAWA